MGGSLQATGTLGCASHAPFTEGVVKAVLVWLYIPVS